jgi:ABC-type sugar transport system ATPase subunit
VLRDGKHVSEAFVKDIDEDYLITNMVGRAIVNMYGVRSPSSKIGKKIFEVKHLTGKKQGPRRTFDDISFSIREGEIVGLSGLVGAGRTETARAIIGADPKESGEVYLEGKKLTIKSPKDAIKNRIGYLSEDRKTQGLITRFSIRENSVSNHLEDFSNGFGFIEDGAITQYALKMKDDLKIACPSVHQLVRNLSGGNQQKVLLGTWFGIGPKVLIVDEPTRGVDVGVKSDIYQQLRKLAASNVAILMISSDLPEILGVSDRILVMQNGKIVGDIPAKGATEEQVISLAAGTEAGGLCE